MAYVSSQWNCMLPGVGGFPSVWIATGTDAHTSVGGVSDFVADGAAKGLRVGDIVIYAKTTATIGATLHVVTAVGAVAATVSAAILA